MWRQAHDVDSSRLNLQLDRLLKGQQRLESSLDAVHTTLEQLQGKLGTVPSVRSSDITTQDGELPRQTSRLALELGKARRKSRFADDSVEVHRVPSSPANSGALRQSSLPSIGTKVSWTRDGPDVVDVESAVASQNGTSGPRISSGRSVVVSMQPAWQRIEMEVAASGYSGVQDFVRQAMAARLTKPTQSSSATNLTWTPLQTVQRLAFHPASSLLTFLDMLRCIFLLIDAIIVPYRIAWQEDDTSGFRLLGWAALAFWILDMLFSFRTGFLDDGNVVTQSLPMAKRYIQGGFLPDMVVIASDAVAMLQPDLGMASSLRQLLAKSLRVLRMLIKLRAGLVNRIQTAVYNWVQVHSLTRYERPIMLTMEFLKLLFVILCLCHIGSCSRQFVMQRVSGEALEDNSLSGSEYLDGMYWAVSTMFSGEPPNLPASLSEVWLSLFWIIMGTLFLTIVTSTLAARLIEFSETQQDINRKVQMLSTFMGQKKTPIWLSLAISANFHKRLLRADPVSERDLPFLHIVTPSLRAALREHQYGSYFLQLPIFRMLSVLHPKLTRGLCFAATCSVFTDAEDVFALQQEMDHAFLLANGLISYNLRMTSIKEFQSLSSDMHAAIKAPTWFCELALFVKWRTKGTAQAEGMCSVLLLSTELFINLITQYFNAAVVAAAYAKQLAKVFLVPETEAFHRCTDVDPGVDTDIVVSTMHTLIRGGLLSLPALELLGQRYNGLWNRATVVTRWNKGLLELEDELLAGKCHLVLGPDGANSINRVVRIAVLELTDKLGRVCVHLLQSLNDDPTPQFNLPGCKVVGNESAEDTMQTFIQNNLPRMAAAIRIRDVQTVIEMGASASYGISTKYIKTIHTAELHGDFIQEGVVEPQFSMGQPSLGQLNSFQMAHGESTLRAELDATGSILKVSSSLPSNLQKSRARVGRRSPALAASSEVSTGTVTTTLSSAEIMHALLGPQARSRLFAVATRNGLEDKSTNLEVDHLLSMQTGVTGTSGVYSTVDVMYEGFANNTLHLYSWLDKDEFFRLRGAQQKDVEEGMLKYASRHFRPATWQEFMAWQVRPDTVDVDPEHPRYISRI